MTDDSIRGICSFAGEEGGDGSSGKAWCAAAVAAILHCCTHWCDRGRLAWPAMGTASDEYGLRWQQVLRLVAAFDRAVGKQWQYGRVGRGWAATGRGYVVAEQRKQGRQAVVKEGNGQMAGGERLRSDGAEGMKRSGRRRRRAGWWHVQ
ncbi:hypothetical protein GW17_00042154 [Ensete ventricosum]|nr:hypothetical protein GW17_00042154 [Ensete ventricosum]